MTSRRTFLKRSTQVGLAAALGPLWNDAFGRRALAQANGSKYKAIVVVTLVGGNDSNNLLIPTDSTSYGEYRNLRGSLALSAGACIPTSGAYAFHPALQNVAGMYNSGRALVVANIGPLSGPLTKAQALAAPSLLPAALMSHPAGSQQWESAQTGSIPTTGWGGRIADAIQGSTGSLPPVVNAGLPSIFTVGNEIQCVALQTPGSWAALPTSLNATILSIANADTSSANPLVRAVASFRSAAMKNQVLISQAMSYAPVKAVFPSSTFGGTMQAVANLIAGRSVVGASQQIFYAQQGNYDTHHQQLATHASQLADFDSTMGAFFATLEGLGLADQVLVCTHSDFNRTMTANTDAGSDHAWGSHQLVLGGGIAGGRVVGSLPDLEVGGSSDLTQQGVWIPTQSVSQMAAGIGGWMGLSSSQLNNIFPDLKNFPSGAITLV